MGGQQRAEEGKKVVLAQRAAVIRVEGGCPLFNPLYCWQTGSNSTKSHPLSKNLTMCASRKSAPRHVPREKENTVGEINHDAKKSSKNGK